jgi:peptidase E
MTETDAERHIVAAGGWSFDEAPDHPTLSQYVLYLARKDRPQICFVPTASGDANDYVVRFYSAFAQLACVPSHLSLWPNPPTADLRSFVLEKDIVCVGGGNTKNLLALWREWELDAIFREAWRRGIVLCGMSAGAICWFEEGITDSIPSALTPLRCLGYLKGSCCPHFDSEPERRPTFHRLLVEGRIGPGYAADDGVALHYVGEHLQQAVTARPSARAYHLALVDSAVVEKPLEPVRLGVSQRPNPQ